MRRRPPDVGTKALIGVRIASTISFFCQHEIGVRQLPQAVQTSIPA